MLTAPLTLTIKNDDYIDTHTDIDKRRLIRLLLLTLILLLLLLSNVTVVVVAAVAIVVVVVTSVPGRHPRPLDPESPP